MIGISFYLNDPLAEERIRFAGKMGVRRAFTSLHIPEESGDLAGRACELLEAAKEAGIEVYADVSARTPAHLGLDSLFSLKSLGVIGLRLDDFFANETILSLAKEFKLALNASILFEEDVRALLEGGLEASQLLAWHNFYPRRETGLSDSFFQEQNELFRKYGIPVSAYIPGDGEKRGSLYEGLPTLEDHREVDPYRAALELFRAGVEDVYIGDPEVSVDLLQKLNDFDCHHRVSIRVEGFQEGEFRLRPDFSRDVLRLMDTRSSESVAARNTVERPLGTITRDNDHYGRYRGEVQITLHDLPADERVNVVGRVVEEDLPLLSLLRPGQLVKLIRV
ncbi:MupG family TIM beta-alpha barrel fold protein [Neobacillus sp. MER 74]|uniref:MupG family TIM beta-alpha barrel fold protein n=1 Tax=Neobacillus sp. MER 74 TaxID=2939566 RepID=UPI00203CF8EB|nr:MupG family TIM beta-alpha barrel fold protein [Neobacillus sp. MER 74]MCM3117228.1 MupG family TIM beta-alpha barrel fold protein [Neobacillus sp. MER 74]